MINFLEILVEKELTISTLAVSFRKDVIDIAIIGSDAYCLACQLKKAQVFAVSMKNLELQANKNAKAKTN